MIMDDPPTNDGLAYITEIPYVYDTGADEDDPFTGPTYIDSAVKVYRDDSGRYWLTDGDEMVTVSGPGDDGMGPFGTETEAELEACLVANRMASPDWIPGEDVEDLRRRVGQ